MKCSFCGKHIDEVDCSCKMCTRCGWSLDGHAGGAPERAEGMHESA